MEQLPDHYWEAVLVHGLLGFPQREGAELLGVSQTTLHRRYTAALVEITHHINGGLSG